MPIYKEVVDEDGVLDWKFNEDKNRLEYLSDTNSSTFEVLIHHRLTTWFFSNIQVTENGITGNYSVPDEIFGGETPICIPAIIDGMQQSDTAKIDLLNNSCKETLNFLKTDFGLTDVECFTYIDRQTNTIVCDVLLLFNETNQQQYRIDLWKTNK